MAVRLGDCVVAGEIRNTKRNSIHGWILLEGEETAFQLDLTGNFDPDLAGWHIRFEARPNPFRSEKSEPFDSKHFAWHQVGAPGTMTAAHKVRVAECSIEEFLRRSELGEPPPTRWVRCLYLEWFSQNGRVVVELPDAEIEYVKRCALEGVPMANPAPETIDQEEADREIESGPATLEVSEVRLDEEGEVEVRHRRYVDPDALDDTEPDEDEESFGTTPADLERMFDEQAAKTDRAMRGDDDDITAELELMDHLIDTNADVPLCSIFEKPMRLPKPDDLDDRQIEQTMHSLLVQLANCGIAYHICEHYTMRDAYRLLVDELLWEGRAFLPLKGTGWVTNFSTHESCKICEAEALQGYEEFDKKYREQNEEYREGMEDEGDLPF